MRGGEWYVSCALGDPMIQPPSRRAGTVRVVATDVDGTVLLPRAPWVSARTVEAIRLAKAAGVTVILATGRRPQTLKPLAVALGLDGPAICCNGALVCDLPSMAVLADERMAPELARQLVHDIRRAIPGVCFAWSCGLEGGCDDTYLASIPASRRLRAPSARADPRGVLLEVIGDIDTHVSTGLTKINVKQPDWSPEELLAVTAAIAGERAMVTKSTAPFVEMHSPGVGKGVALARICTEMGVDRADVVAVGDGHNDLDMLLWAGRGVAMENAHPSVLMAVRERTRSNAHDGVADVLEALVSH